MMLFIYGQNMEKFHYLCDRVLLRNKKAGISRQEKGEVEQRGSLLLYHIQEVYVLDK